LEITSGNYNSYGEMVIAGSVSKQDRPLPTPCAGFRW
jgi:hypothetical protein